MATYTAKQYSAELDRRIKSFAQSKALADCVLETHRLQINRLFIQGEGADGKLGTYSKAYAARKRKAGREANFVNFNFTDFLQNDFANSITKKGNTYVTGVKNVRNPNPPPAANGKPSKSKGATNSEKVDYLKQRYGAQAFDLTKEEREFFSDCITETLLDYLRGEK